MNDMFAVLKQKSLITEFIADNMKVLILGIISLYNCWAVK